MERSKEILVAFVEPEPIGSLVGCLVTALRARWSMSKDVAKVLGLCCQFAASGKASEDPYLELLPGSTRRLSFFLCFYVLCVPFPALTNICERDLCTLSNAHCVGCASCALV